jgi:hypothetical protein
MAHSGGIMNVDQIRARIDHPIIDADGHLISTCRSCATSCASRRATRR